MKQEVGLVSEHNDHGDEEKGVLPHRLSKRFGNTKCQTAYHVLLAGKEVKYGVVAAWWIVPDDLSGRYAFNVLISKFKLGGIINPILEEELDECRTKDGDENRCAEQ